MAKGTKTQTGEYAARKTASARGIGRARERVAGYPPPRESREEELEQCIGRLLECPELATGCGETRAAVADATDVLYGQGPDEMRQVRNTVLSIGAQTEAILAMLDQLHREMGEVKKGVFALSKEERQRKLF